MQTVFEPVQDRDGMLMMRMRGPRGESLVHARLATVGAEMGVSIMEQNMVAAMELPGAGQG